MEQEIQYVVILQCANARKRCSGCACMDAFYEKSGFFASCGYEASVRYLAITCGGCSGSSLAGQLEHFMQVMHRKHPEITKEQVAVHLSSCMVTDNHHHDRCPHLEIIQSILQKKGFSKICYGTYQSINASKKRAQGVYHTYF